MRHLLSFLRRCGALFDIDLALNVYFLSRDAKSLVKHLLVADVTKRYGCLRNGANDIKNHRWFKNLDWFKLGQKRLPVPFIPQVGRPGDTSNFTEYPDSDT